MMFKASYTASQEAYTCLAAYQVGLAVLRLIVAHVHAGRHAHGTMFRLRYGLGCIMLVASRWLASAENVVCLCAAC
jgi:hypothetical protein